MGGEGVWLSHVAKIPLRPPGTSPSKLGGGRCKLDSELNYTSRSTNLLGGAVRRTEGEPATSDCPVTSKPASGL